MVVTVYVCATPVLKVTVDALVMLGAWAFVRVNVWVAAPVGLVAVLAATLLLQFRVSAKRAVHGRRSQRDLHGIAALSDDLALLRARLRVDLEAHGTVFLHELHPVFWQHNRACRAFAG